ncbi:hypothetical protein AOLI_G00052040 [Acnodon oligacanthus]
MALIKFKRAHQKAILVYCSTCRHHTVKSAVWNELPQRQTASLESLPLTAFNKVLLEAQGLHYTAIEPALGLSEWWLQSGDQIGQGEVIGNKLKSPCAGPHVTASLPQKAQGNGSTDLPSVLLCPAESWVTLKANGDLPAPSGIG